MLPAIVAGVCEEIASLFCTVVSEPELPQPVTKQDRSIAVTVLHGLRVYLDMSSSVVNSKLIKYEFTNLLYK